MELIVKHFSELSNDELLDIMRLRVSVFVVEQKCAYQEIDEADRSALHVILRDGDEICAYLRVFMKNVTTGEALIGRVLSTRRRCGLGVRTVSAGIDAARERLGARRIVIEAQTYARGLYEKCGFRQTSEEFTEDGIPHIKMELSL